MVLNPPISTTTALYTIAARLPKLLRRQAGVLDPATPTFFLSSRIRLDCLKRLSMGGETHRGGDLGRQFTTCRRTQGLIEAAAPDKNRAAFNAMTGGNSISVILTFRFCAARPATSSY
jgi:hypothetical protein